MAWWVSAATQPAETEDALRARGAELIDAVQVLARELGGGLPELDVPRRVVVELVRDERTFRASSAVTVRGWGRTEPERPRSPPARGGGGRPGELVQLPRGGPVDGEPVRPAAARWTARWRSCGARSRCRASRGRGSYRAVLAERLRLARDHGATLALVKGRVLTSGPILLRAGFADYGEERCYWLPVS